MNRSWEDHDAARHYVQKKGMGMKEQAWRSRQWMSPNITGDTTMFVVKGGHLSASVFTLTSMMGNPVFLTEIALRSVSTWSKREGKTTPKAAQKTFPHTSLVSEGTVSKIVFSYLEVN